MANFLIIIQSDTSSVFSTIAKASTLTAQNTTLDSYDYWTMTIAIIACVVSLGSFFIAYQTLVSQRQTEKNTQTLSISSLVKMLNHILEIAYINSIRSCAILKKLEDASYTEYPFANQVRYMKLPQHYILAEKCSGLPQDAYLELVKLNRAVSKYNEQLDFFFSTLKDESLSRDIKEYEATRLRYESLWLLFYMSKTIKSINADREDGGLVLTPFEVITNVHETFSQDAGNGNVQIVNLPEEIVNFYTEVAVADGYKDKTMMEMVNSDINIFLGKNKRDEIFIPMIKVNAE